MSEYAEFVDSPDAEFVDSPDAEWIPSGDGLTVSIDALIQKTLSQTSSLDALIRKDFIPITLSLDAYLKVIGEATTDLDALIKEFGLTGSTDIDSLLKKIGVVETTEIDAILKAMSGTICWGHNTDVAETAIDYLSLWAGSGTISGAGDTEIMTLLEGESMTSPVWNLGEGVARLSLNKYNSGDDVTKEYRTGATSGDCGSASWNDYSNYFTSLGYVQIRLSKNA